MSQRGGYEEFLTAVPYPLPRGDGLTEEEEVQSVEARAHDAREEMTRTLAARDAPDSFSARVAAGVGAAVARTKAGVGDVEAVALRKQYEFAVASERARLAEKHGLPPADVLATYACASCGGAGSLAGHVVLTPTHLRFYTDASASGRGGFAVALTDVLSIQKAVELPTYPHSLPCIIPLPDPAVEWNALQLYCVLGRRYQLHKFRQAGQIPSVKAYTATYYCPRALEKCFVWCDRLWRAAVDVDKLVEERSDYGKQNPAFIYPERVVLSS
eukprot:Rhum_TRINITY_DN14692_c8_g2::Rhum_TRINITY_DN14692_c8_g2_i1::g.108800::m.108800